MQHRFFPNSKEEQNTNQKLAVIHASVHGIVDKTVVFLRMFSNSLTKVTQLNAAKTSSGLPMANPNPVSKENYTEIMDKVNQAKVKTSRLHDNNPELDHTNRNFPAA